jgi:Ca-activated chloride channel family protein
VTLLWPVLVPAVLIVPLLVALYIWALRRRRPVAVRFSNLGLVREAVPRTSRIRRHLPFALFAFALASLLFALTRPVVIAAVPTGQATVILTIDVSRSMCSTDIQPSRLEVAKAAAAKLIERQGSDRLIGLVAFAGFAEIIQVPTGDQEVLLDAVGSLTTGRRTAIGSAILTSIDAIAGVDGSVAPAITDTTPRTPPAPVPKGAYVPHIVVLLTDGASNAGPEPVDAAQQAVDRGVRVYTIGFGTADPGDSFRNCGPTPFGRDPFGTTPGGIGGSGAFGGGAFRRGIDEVTLRRVAEMTGAEYYSAETADQLDSVFASLPTQFILRHEALEVTVVFAALGVALAGGALLLARLWRPWP